ncbi:hypothetical protein MPOCJGCO_1214 [Methylobacterium trifolii]|uniref:Uncharacterized protein n=2 Tax=Methylobacterium trifolii TaxID=1003092 RepID=A0ABQ4TWQ3_9HYPH|nr:hypothetical protein MPOCJGCO_1214 [Methylobacterium trifolii]
MLTGPFQRLPGSSEGWTAGDPWLLPISDGFDAKASAATESAAEAVRGAARPLWIAAHGLCLALALLLAAEGATGWMGGGSQAVHPVAKVPVVTASAS